MGALKGALKICLFDQPDQPGVLQRLQPVPLVKHKVVMVEKEQYHGNGTGTVPPAVAITDRQFYYHLLVCRTRSSYNQEAVSPLGE